MPSRRAWPRATRQPTGTTRPRRCDRLKRKPIALVGPHQGDSPRTPSATYLRDEGLDLLYAHCPVARRLLADAAERSAASGSLRVITAEGLIGFKLQALVNNPSAPATSTTSGRCCEPSAGSSTWPKSANTEEHTISGNIEVRHRRLSEVTRLMVRESVSLEVSKCIYTRLPCPTRSGGLERAFIE